MGRRPNPPVVRPPNPLRNRREMVDPPPIIRKAVAGAAAAARTAKRACPNKECYAPQVEDGICHNCGTIIDDSNIVAEIQFGESSSGAAVVQGSFVSADQGTAKSLGPAFRRAGGSEDRESTIREGKRIMQALANQLTIPESVVNSGVQIFKLAAMNNFIQGRRMDMVASVCLYSACRKEKPCRVMLIDFADKVQVNVFKLGHTFKALHNAITLAKDGIQPVLPEDLIYRFAMKLEFGLLTTKVAEDAVRMVQRMSLDWMVMGRRPSGVCGACLILAARMNNFRRTITEVVYIVKVTTHTIQKRLDEFKLTPSSALTVEEFLNNEFLESAHDPPSFYEKSEEFQKNKKTRKRRRKGHDGIEGEEDEGVVDDEQNKRQKTATPNPDQAIPTVELRRDADGFAIPPQPPHHHNIPIDPDLIDEAIEDESGTSLQRLVEQFGDAVDANDEELVPSLESRSRRGSRIDLRRNPQIYVPEDWENDERSMESEISEMISDPNTVHHAVSYAKAKRRAAYHMLIAEVNNPQREVSMDLHIGEDEFADDPEVLNCMLSPEDVAKKEKLWVNENKVWLRKQQVKIYQKKMEEQGPPKATRNRKKKARIGEGQTSAASSPGEAAVAALKERTWSKKINYDAIRGMFDDSPSGSILGSAATSRRTSRAGSTVASSVAGSVAGDEESEMGESAAGDEEGVAVPVKPAVVGMIAEQEEEEGEGEGEREEDDEGAADDDYESAAGSGRADEEEEVDDWKSNFKRPRGDGEEEDDDDNVGYGEDGDFGDDDPF